jgi:hypothetical protein
MKIEQLLVQHFYNTRKVTLQGLGTFTLSPDFVMPMDDKDLVMPENAITFQYDPRSVEDDELISYIVQQTRKIRPLAAADLDSYLTLGKQFLNIGKPFRIEGLGRLDKNQTGQYEFIQGNFSNLKKEMTAAPASLKEKEDRTDISFAAPSKSSPISKKGIIASALLIGLALIGVVSWYLFFREKKGTDEASVQPVPSVPAPVDTSTKKTTAAIDTSIHTTANTVAPAPAKDGYTFKIVFKETNVKATALERFNTMTTRGHKVIMYTSDSINYKVAEVFTLPLSDTTRVKDSLNKYFYSGKARVELN